VCPKSQAEPSPVELPPRCFSRRRVRTEERNPVHPFAAAEHHRSAVAVGDPSQAAVEPHRWPSFVVVRRCSLHRLSFPSLRRFVRALEVVKKIN
ncbi:Os08g0293900, partial [Oryza sativa Japonica Group]